MNYSEANITHLKLTAFPGTTDQVSSSEAEKAKHNLSSQGGSAISARKAAEGNCN